MSNLNLANPLSAHFGELPEWTKPTDKSITEPELVQAKREMIDNSLRDYVSDEDIAQAVDDCQALLCDREQTWTLEQQKDSAFRFVNELTRQLEESLAGYQIKDYIEMNLR